MTALVLEDHADEVAHGGRVGVLDEMLVRREQTPLVAAVPLEEGDDLALPLVGPGRLETRLSAPNLCHAVSVDADPRHGQGRKTRPASTMVPWSGSTSGCSSPAGQPGGPRTSDS